MPTYFIQTYGCQANKSDSERIAGDYQARGWQPAKNWQTCDDLVINTCAIRQRAEDRARSFIYRVGLYFQKIGQPRPKIILTGCMNHHGEAQLLKMIPNLDRVLPIDEVGFDLTPVRTDKKHAFVPISSGCNSFCSYCIVPYSRGREKSRPLAEIIAEVENLARQGYQEITLLGQNVNSYGLEKVGISLRKMLLSHQTLTLADLPSNQSQYQAPTGLPPFVELIQKISAIDQIKIIRFLSANPWDFHDQLIAEIGRNPKLDRYIHLPIQSGSDAVLKRMNRGYSVSDYENLVTKLRAADPNIVIGTDIIVGFANETDEEFAETVAVAKRINWQIGFVAMYSPRPGTAASRIYPDEIPHAVKKKRWKILDQIINVDHLAVRPKVV